MLNGLVDAAALLVPEPRLPLSRAMSMRDAHGSCTKVLYLFCLRFESVDVRGL
jgi:hypothetical protein